MSEFITAITRRSSLRAMTSKLSSGEIEKVLGDLASILEDKREQEAALAAEQEAKAKIIADIKEKMDSAGITLGTLKIAIEKDLTIPVASKYEIEIDGETHRWSGRGRTPAAFARYMEEQGITKEQLPKTI